MSSSTEFTLTSGINVAVSHDHPHFKDNGLLKMSLLPLSVLKCEEPFCQTPDAIIECAICYKRIYNKVFVCTEPCNKTFHPDCLDKMIEQLEETAYENEIKTSYRCCYCRREMDMKNHSLEVFMNQLLELKKQGYYVDDAIKQAIYNSTLEPGSEDFMDTFEYAIYVPIVSFKPPKQSNKATYKHINRKPHHSKIRYSKMRR